MKVFFASILFAISSLALAHRITHIKISRPIYCVNKHMSFGTYKKLKNTKGHVHQGIHHGKRAFHVDETCEELLDQCEEQFGEGYIYLQSGQDYIWSWDIVIDNEGEICRHRYSTDYQGKGL